jgi:pyruvate dehydrogenase E1 component
MRLESGEEIRSLTTSGKWDQYDVDMLERIQRRVLWLATSLVNHANYIRPNPDGIKVGGHEASSASVVTLMTALYFYFLRPGDRVSVKPHASPVFHAIQFLRGFLPQEKLRTFRQFKGLQAYPSRTKDPDEVDFSTGSVGLGAVACLFGALARDYVLDHYGSCQPGHYISIVGDAELDEGNVWEALGEEYIHRLSQVIWIIDLNRQSLDRVVPDGRAQRLEEMFRVNGWRVIDLKYGKKLEAVFRRPYGHKLRARIDDMSNEEYQSLLLKDGESIRARLVAPDGRFDPLMAELLEPYHPSEVKELLGNLGGHDLRRVLEAFDEAFTASKQPVAIFAYTIKGWGLPFAGNPANHAGLLKPAQIEELRESLGIAPGEEFPPFPATSEEAVYIEQRLEALGWRKPFTPPTCAKIEIPERLGAAYHGMLSTQSALGAILLSLSRRPEIAKHLVTVSPDVATSTNLGGWIHRMGVYSRRPTRNYFKEEGISLLIDWRESPSGHHIELGISENNLFLLLTALGLADEFHGHRLLPVGTIYDPFICRALDAFIYAAYSDARFIIVGTPSGISLSPEGGAHQSIITPGVGVQLPGVTYHEPAFGTELEWILLNALRQIQERDHSRGASAYLRVSTKPLDQEVFNALAAKRGADELRAQVLRGGYRFSDRSAEPGYRPGENVVHLFVSGVMIKEALAASEELRAQGVFANVFNVTSADLLFHDCMAVQKARMRGEQRTSWLEELIPAEERKAPIVTVHDAHPHTLSFIGGALSTRMINLGVTEFGQSGTQADLYRAYEIDTPTIVSAAQWLVAQPQASS